MGYKDCVRIVNWQTNLYNKAYGTDNPFKNIAPNLALNIEKYINSNYSERNQKLFFYFFGGTSMSELQSGFNISRQRIYDLVGKLIKTMQTPLVKSIIHSPDGIIKVDRFSDIFLLDIPKRYCKALKRSGINTIEDLCSKTEEEILQINGVSIKTLEKIRYELKQYNFSLRK